MTSPGARCDRILELIDLCLAEAVLAEPFLAEPVGAEAVRGAGPVGADGESVGPARGGADGDRPGRRRAPI